jgi:hypothetical protein
MIISLITTPPAQVLQVIALKSRGNQIGASRFDLYELVVNRGLRAADLAVNGVIVVARREALSRGKW